MNDLVTEIGNKSRMLDVAIAELKSAGRNMRKLKKPTA